MELEKDLLEYFKKSSGIEFVQYFYGILLTDSDKQDFLDYSKVSLYRCNGLSPYKISKLVAVQKRRIDNWIYNKNKPFIIRLLEHYLLLNKPTQGRKWLSINSTRGGLLTGPWVQVPEKIDKCDEIITVISQLKELPKFHERLFISRFTTASLKRENLFAYFLGMLVGDSSKSGIKRKQRITRRVQIRLSKRFLSNEKLGDFVCLCVLSLGLRMTRTKDCPAGKRNTHPFYSWASQSSSFVQWIFSVALGLKDNENTTYFPIKASWLLTAPRAFKIHFLQGLADSDGFVDFSSQQAGIIVEPNRDLISKLFDSFGIKTTPKLFTKNKLWALMLNLRDAFTLPIFSPFVHSYRYIELESIFNAKRIIGHWPPWLVNKIEQNIKSGCNGTELVRKILREEGIAVRAKHIRERAKKFEKMKELTCLGIESTAL